MEMEIQFKNDMAPLDEAIRVTLFSKLSDLNELIKKYGKDNFLNTEGSRKEYSDFVTGIISDVVNCMSKNYLKFIRKKYFSELGILYYITCEITTTLNEYITRVER